jgi:hypothetical protein
MTTASPIPSRKHLNPDYFLNGALHQQHTSAIYGITLDHRDIRPYPLERLAGHRRIALEWTPAPMICT